MSLACSCFDDYEWFYEVEKTERVSAGEGKCYGCCKTIKIAQETRRLHRFELDEEGWETNYRYLGRLCPVCSGLYDSLLELGFCLTADYGFITEAMDQYRSHDF